MIDMMIDFNSLSTSQDSDFDLDNFDDLSTKHTPNSCMAQIYEVQDGDVGMRLDKLVATVFNEHSRAVLQKAIQNGDITVNDLTAKPKYLVKNGDMISVNIIKTTLEDLPENIALDIVYEDDSVLVINKPVGLVVHPGAGNQTGTLVNALLFHYPMLASLPRAGLVHRIDKDTSGLLIVAKSAKVQLDLINQLKDKSVYREYLCVVTGDFETLNRYRTIDLPIARHSTQRTKMAVRQTGKTAVTHIKHITPLIGDCYLLNVMLETGRTHQIRVHLSHIGCPLIGDSIYGKPIKIDKALDDAQYQGIKQFARQALHAHKLGFIHPITLKQVVVQADMPSDMADLLAMLTD